MLSAPIAAVENLKAALAFANKHDLGMPLVLLDLTNRPASGVDLSGGDDGCELVSASRRSAGKRIAVSPDLDGCRLR